MGKHVLNPFEGMYSLIIDEVIADIALNRGFFVVSVESGRVCSPEILFPWNSGWHWSDVPPQVAEQGQSFAPGSSKTDSCKRPPEYTASTLARCCQAIVALLCDRQQNRERAFR